MRVLFVFLLCILGAEGVAQHWRPLGRGVIGPGEASTIFGDSISDKLLLGGSFQRIINTNDTVLGIGIAAWDGNRWDSLAHRIQALGGNFAQKIYLFSRFQGALQACGTYSLADGISPANFTFAQLNEALGRWERLSCTNPLTNGLQGLLPQIPQGPSIYATGFTGSLCGYPEACVFRYDGTAFYEWEPWALLPPFANDYVGYVFDFQGYTYMTGLFNDPSGTPASFLRWDGNGWEHVPGWGNMLAVIKDFTIRNDTLYIIGTFRTDEGGPGNSIASYDGQNWNDLGGGLTLAQSPSSTVATRMEWFHDELYVCGQFDQAAGVYMDNIAKWNGVQWCSLPGNLEHPFLEFNIVDDFTVWRDSLYICGAFTMADGQECKHVALWIGGDAVLNCSSPVSVPEPAVHQALTIHPNPAREQVTFICKEPVQVTVFDALSRKVWQGRVQGRMNVDVSDWEPGTYIVRHGTGTSKLVVVR